MKNAATQTAKFGQNAGTQTVVDQSDSSTQTVPHAPQVEYSSTVGQKRIRTLTDAKNEMQKMKHRKRTIILPLIAPVSTLKQDKKVLNIALI